MNFHHKKEFKELESDCPPDSYTEIKLNCYRWVFSDIKDNRNFLSQAEKNPKVLNNKTDEMKCAYFALSFHDSEDNSQKHFDYLSKIVKNAKKRLGSHIAKGTIFESDGLAGEIETNGHFNFHHAKKNGFYANFNILRPL